MTPSFFRVTPDSEPEALLDAVRDRLASLESIIPWKSVAINVEPLFAGGIELRPSGEIHVSPESLLHLETDTVATAILHEAAHRICATGIEGDKTLVVAAGHDHDRYFARVLAMLAGYAGIELSAHAQQESIANLPWPLTYRDAMHQLPKPSTIEQLRDEIQGCTWERSKEQTLLDYDALVTTLGRAAIGIAMVGFALVALEYMIKVAGL